MTRGRRLYTRAALAIMGLGLGACAGGLRLYSTQSPQADFSGYRTYGYVPQLGTDEPGQPMSLLTQLLRSAVDREMQARGYRQVTGNADLLVNFYVETQEKIQSRTMESPPIGVRAGYYGYRRGIYGTWATYSETAVTQFTEGTLNIDLVDTRRQELVWEGVAVGRVTERVRANIRTTVDTVVAQVFEQYPYRARS